MSTDHCDFHAAPFGNVPVVRKSTTGRTYLCRGGLKQFAGECSPGGRSVRIMDMERAVTLQHLPPLARRGGAVSQQNLKGFAMRAVRRDPRRGNDRLQSSAAAVDVLQSLTQGRRLERQPGTLIDDSKRWTR
jgi:hypothetical protein